MYCPAYSPVVAPLWSVTQLSGCSLVQITWVEHPLVPAVLHPQHQHHQLVKDNIICLSLYHSLSISVSFFAYIFVYIVTYHHVSLYTWYSHVFIIMYIGVIVCEHIYTRVCSQVSIVFSLPSHGQGHISKGIPFKS